MITAEQRLKVQKILASNSLTRTELANYRDRILNMIEVADPHRAELMRAFDNATPSDSYLVFMGFCPGADFSHRQDLRWRQLGICEFEFDESEIQIRRFAGILVGDQIILKKREIIGKTMKLYGHGKVVGVDYTPEGRRFLRMDWAATDIVIKVPLMGCNSTVNLKKTSAVLKDMPSEFHAWLYGNFV